MLIQFSKGLSQQQKEKVLVSYYEEHLEEVERAHAHSYWLDVRGFVETLRPEILAQQRREIVSQKTKSKKT